VSGATLCTAAGRAEWLAGLGILLSVIAFLVPGLLRLIGYGNGWPVPMLQPGPLILLALVVWVARAPTVPGLPLSAR
jgi:hypothetical protein